MSITIDLDLIERREYVDQDPREVGDLELLKYLFNINYICRSTRCKVCKTRKGLHIYIAVKDYDINKAMVLRAMLGDDPIRLEIDMYRHYKGLREYMETLFKAKYSKDGISVEKCVDWKTFFKRLVESL